jgi:hypothetical protein
MTHKFPYHPHNLWHALLSPDPIHAPLTPTHAAINRRAATAG